MRANAALAAWGSQKKATPGYDTQHLRCSAARGQFFFRPCPGRVLVGKGKLPPGAETWRDMNQCTKSSDGLSEHSPEPGQRVVVGMSGGVDSSVAAALLAAAGYDVVGIFMRLLGSGPESGCCSLDDCFDARRVAARLRIPFSVMDVKERFGCAVVEPFVSEYLQGRTPNPCVHCNRSVKFCGLWERARALGAQWIATGHYARVRRDPETGRAQLWSATDAAKDQSYFLFALEPEVLQRTLLPLGEMTKAEVRARAQASNTAF